MAKTPTNKTTTKRTSAADPAVADAIGAAAGSAVHEPEVIAASSHRSEAKTRFSTALEEAKAGAAALKAEAGERVGIYRNQAEEKRGDLLNEARSYGDEAKVKASELAIEGKAKASDALAALGRMVADNATQIDDQFGPKYGDYARNAARSLQENAAKLEAKSIEELGEDTKEFVRKSPGTALGIAAIGGYILARLFRR